MRVYAAARGRKCSQFFTGAADQRKTSQRQSSQVMIFGTSVAVDSGRCVGCGACLQVCPAGVFAASGGAATAQNPDACRLCGRCTQVCRPGAVMLNG